jgi:cold shock CspA family protein
MLKMRTYRKHKSYNQTKSHRPPEKSTGPQPHIESQPYVDTQPTYHDHLPKPDKIRQYGVVMKVFKDRGFGFIKNTVGQEVYFRINGVVPVSGQKASFYEKPGAKGPMAVEVKFT